jgi:hypothetical protein
MSNQRVKTYDENIAKNCVENGKYYNAAATSGRELFIKIACAKKKFETSDDWAFVPKPYNIAGPIDDITEALKTFGLSSKEIKQVLKTAYMKDTIKGNEDFEKECTECAEKNKKPPVTIDSLKQKIADFEANKEKEALKRGVTKTSKAPSKKGKDKPSPGAPVQSFDDKLLLTINKNREKFEESDEKKKNFDSPPSYGGIFRDVSLYSSTGKSPDCVIKPGSNSKKYWVEGLPIASNTPEGFFKAIKELGSDYYPYAYLWAQKYEEKEEKEVDMPSFVTDEVIEKAQEGEYPLMSARKTSTKTKKAKPVKESDDESEDEPAPPKSKKLIIVKKKPSTQSEKGETPAVQKKSQLTKQKS